MSKLTQQVERRRTFAIISHPDAGKTTLTEKLLLYGGAIHLAGSVKARRAQRHATSDWMELEQQRGISVTSSVMQFPYKGLEINLLDTPGHKDFSEDTYRTLAAADCAVMLIDVAKGVEPQTRKLFEVCALRGIPIFTFINKMDRFGHPPLDLMAEIEEVLGIRTCPINWPVGMGREFRGVYDRRAGVMALHDADATHGESAIEHHEVKPDSPELAQLLGKAVHEQLMEEIELLEIAGDPYDLDRVRAGKLSPVFFGSALTNFGVELFLDAFIEMAPSPIARTSNVGVVEPDDERFSGFIFKVQANMNPNHRDRIAFMRICSGTLETGMNVFHDRLGREVQIKDARQFLAQERVAVDEAVAGDIVGLYDTGLFRIGDTLAVGQPADFHYDELRRFSPEIFARVRLNKVLKRKALEKGLRHLADEGAVQLFESWNDNDVEPILGAVGQLQFEVLKYRLEAEYKVDVTFDALPFTCARWVDGASFDPRKFQGREATTCVKDKDGRALLLLRNEWALNWIKQDYKDLKFFTYAPDGRNVEADV